MPESVISRSQSLLELQQLIVTHFDLEELQMVAFALSVDWDELKGTTKSLKTIALIRYVDRRGEIEPLLDLLRHERPVVRWPQIHPAEPETTPLAAPSDTQLIDVNVQSQSGGTVNVGNIITGYVDGDIVQGDKVTGGIVISGSITGDVHINYTIRPDIPRPPSPSPIPEIPLFVGRESELTYYQTMLDRSGLAVIGGMAGMGKTTLAAVMARRFAKPDRTFWHVFHEGEGIENVIWRLAGFLAWRGQEDLWRLLQNTRLTGGRPPPPESLFDYVTQLLRGRDYLLCFDDFQHVDEDPLLHQLVEQLRVLLGGGELRMIITTRRIPEFVQRVIAFDPLGGMSPADTRRLLEAQEISLTGDRLDQLHTYTGGNAQLLALAVDILRDAGGAASLLDRLIDADNIERYLLDEIDGRLTRDERQVMSAVAVLQGYPAARDAVEMVLDGRGTRRILRDLADRSLLTVSRVDEERLYAQHAIVRDFYYSSLGRAQRREMHLRAGQFYRGEGQDLPLAARHYYLGEAFAEAADLATTDVRATINRGQTQQLGRLLALFRPEQLDAMRWAAVKNAEGQVFLYLGESQPANDAFQTALTALGSLPDSDETRRAAARACLGMGELLTQQAPEEALGWLERGLSAAESLDDELEAALTLQTGEVYMFTKRYEEAQPALERGLASLPPGPSQWRATALENLSVVTAFHLGDITTAITLGEQALAISLELTDTFSVSKITTLLGACHYTNNDWPAAEVYFRRAVDLAIQTHNRKVQAQAEANLGTYLILVGQHIAAREHLEHGLKLARETDQHIGACQLLLNLTDLQIRRNDWVEAEKRLQEAASMADDLKLVMFAPWIARLKAEIALGTGALEAALELSRAALELAYASGDDLEIGLNVRVVGQSLLAAGRVDESIQALERSLDLLQGSELYEATRSRALLGTVFMEAGRREEGHALLLAAQEVFQQLGAEGELPAVSRGLEALSAYPGTP